MSTLLYSAVDQIATVQGVPNTGVDFVPGNVEKMILVDLAGFSMTAAQIVTSAAWTTFLADTTKSHVVTEFVTGFEIPPTTPITQGGNDASTFRGMPITRATSFAAAKGMFLGADPVTIKALRKMAAKSGNFQIGTRVGVLFIHEDSGLRARSPLTTGGAVRPFPLSNFFISDLKMGGLGASDDYELGFNMPGRWSDDQVIYQLAFAGAALVNPAP